MHPRTISAEPASESVRDFDPDSFRVHDVCRPAAGPVDDGVVALEAKAELMNTTDCLVDVIYDKSDMIDMDALRLEIPCRRNLDETQVEAVGSAEYAPSGAPLSLLLELNAQKSGIESGGNLEIADRDLDMINTSRIDGGRPDATRLAPCQPRGPQGLACRLASCRLRLRRGHGLLPLITQCPMTQCRLSTWPPDRCCLRPRGDRIIARRHREWA